MKTIGLLGGMSWESTLSYYQIMNRIARAQGGGLCSAKLILYSFDFRDITECQQQRDWKKAGDLLIDAAQKLEKSGAQGLLIATNTMHKVADRVADAIHIPLLNIIDATAAVLKQRGIKKIGLLGTCFTMEDGFYHQRMLDQHGVEVLVPNESDRALVHHVIFQELCMGQTTEQSRVHFHRIISDLVALGAEAVVLGCTEIGLLLEDGCCSEVPLIDSTMAHAEMAMKWALSNVEVVT